MHEKEKYQVIEEANLSRRKQILDFVVVSIQERSN